MRLLLSGLCALFLLPGGRLSAQTLNESDFTCYTRMQGLSNNIITGIVQDSRDYIWVGTNRGLNRFDGRFFTNFNTGSPVLPLPGNTITELRRQGNEIIGSTQTGAFVFDAENHRYLSLVLPGDPLSVHWTNTCVSSMRDGKGHYIFSSRTGLYVFDAAGKVIRRFDYYLPGDARRKELYFGEALSTFGDGKILQNNEMLFSAYDPETNRIDTAFGRNNAAFKKAIADSAGGVRQAFAGRNNEVFIINEEKNILSLFDFRLNRNIELELPLNVTAEMDIYSSRFCVLNDSVLAITGKSSGFYLLNYRAGADRLTLIGKKHFSGKHCSVVFEDREGRLWVGTTDGLYKQNQTNPFFRGADLSLADPRLQNCDIRTVYATPDKLFVGFRNNGGLLMLDKISGKAQRRFDFSRWGLKCNTLATILPYAGDTVWLATGNGILWFHTRNFSFGRVPLPPALAWVNDTHPICMLNDGRGNIWISMSPLNTVLRYNLRTRTFSSITAATDPRFSITYCFSMTADSSGNIWFAGDGLCRYNVRKQAVDTLITTFPGRNPTSVYAYLIGSDSENLWLYSYDNGLVQYDLARNKVSLRKEENNFWEGNVITSSRVIRNRLWMGVDNGVFAFDVHDYSNRLFTYADGLPTAGITTVRNNILYDSADNLCYLGSGHHLISFRPELPQATEKPPVLFIDEINTAGEVQRGSTDLVSLTYPDNGTQIEFNAVNLRNPEDNRFAYRVSPATDSSWHLLHWQHNVNFTNLASGKYEVQLKLFSSNNRWPDQLRTITIVVHPPFWRTTWFRILALVGFVGIVGFIYGNRVRHIREKLGIDRQMAEYEMKALHAQMNPHFIFNALNSIKEMILHQDTRNASVYLSRFAHLIRLSLEHSRKTFITLNQNIEYLNSYLEMEKLRFADFTYRIRVRGDLNADEIKLAPMLIQPLVENAIWHGLLPNTREKQLSILFFVQDEMLICEIEDNGIGIRQSMEMKKNSQATHAPVGLGNIQQRIRILNEKYRINCSLSIEDKADIEGISGSGTITTLTVPA